MVSSGGEENLFNNTSKYTTLSSSFSTSSFSSSSPLASPSSTLTLADPSRFEPTNSTTAMEEVWEDININLSSLHTHHSSLHTHHSSPTFRGVILQDFFARPFSKSPSSSLPPADYGSPTPPQPSRTLLPLNLNSDPNQHLPFLGPVSSDDQINRRAPICNVGPRSMTLDHFLASSTSPSSLLANDGLRRFPETNDRSSDGVGDRRHKRMIKNRESAARSRARKQAYTNELESEIEGLKEQVARLKQQLQQSVELSQAATSTGKFPRKGGLRRTASAPV